MQGIIKFFNTEKGFGFIVPEDGSADMFMHISACEEGYTPQEGDHVTFDVGTGKDGRSAASNVSFLSEGSEGGDEDAE